MIKVIFPYSSTNSYKIKSFTLIISFLSRYLRLSTGLSENFFSRYFCQIIRNIELITCFTAENTLPSGELRKKKIKKFRYGKHGRRVMLLAAFAGVVLLPLLLNCITTRPFYRHCDLRHRDIRLLAGYDEATRAHTKAGYNLAITLIISTDAQL